MPRGDAETASGSSASVPSVIVTELVGGHVAERLSAAARRHRSPAVDLRRLSQAELLLNGFAPKLPRSRPTCNSPPPPVLGDVGLDAGAVAARLDASPDLQADPVRLKPGFSNRRRRRPVAGIGAADLREDVLAPSLSSRRTRRRAFCRWPKPPRSSPSERAVVPPHCGT